MENQEQEIEKPIEYEDDHYDLFLPRHNCMSLQEDMDNLFGL